MNEEHDGLIERRDGFDYDYRMRCECGAATSFSAQDYADQINDCHIPCAACGEEIHFGPAVTTIRDPQDPALNDSKVPTLPWYHSSTWSDWPSLDYSKTVGPRLRRSAKRLGLSPSHDLRHHLSLALHVGTYEAAIENMLRRMRNQADEQTQFHLYRVRLRPGLRLNIGYRDENLEAAAQATADDLDGLGIDALRYVNVHEAPGTLSLAVQPGAVASTQRVEIPILQLGGQARRRVPRRSKGVQQLASRSGPWSTVRNRPSQRRSGAHSAY